MNWIILILAGFCETGFTFCLGKTKMATGIEWWAWIFGFLTLSILSTALLAKAAQAIPIGTAYPIWTGIGTVGAVLMGIFIFHEPASSFRIFLTIILTLSIIGLKIVE